MTNFLDQMKSTATNSVEYNGAVTENGALGFATTGKALLDLNFAVASLRRASVEEIVSKFEAAYTEDSALATAWLFYARDVREGLGERRLFRVAARHLFTAYTLTDEQQAKFLSYIVEYGRYDDMFTLFGITSTIDSLVVAFIKEQLNADLKAMAENKSVSLLAKWMPSEKASAKSTVTLAKGLARELHMSAKEYRKTLSALRAYIDVTEVKMCSKEWDKIDYSTVPSKAGLNYKRAFLRHDEERYSDFINKVNAGEAKINAAVLYPHDIVAKYREGMRGWYRSSIGEVDNTLEALWKNLPDTVKGNGTTLVVADGSGSMTSSIGGSKVAALDVANALAVYFAERASGVYKDKYITFSHNPQFVDFSGCATLREKLNEAYRHNEVADTNIEKVFKLILDTAVRNHSAQEDIPANILIISDMEFNSAVDGRCDVSLFQDIAEQYAAAGYKLPRLVFWNVNSRTGTIPVVQNDLGVALVSGFSVNIAKMVMDQELDPYKCLVNVLTSDRYKDVLETFKK